MQQQPLIIQGGMGVAVSSWRLARAVSLRGQLGVVSGTAIDTVVARRLQQGDPGGHLREAFDAFPVREVAERVWDRYYIAGGKDPAAPFKSKPIHSIKMPVALLDLIVISNFAEVFLAKAGHSGKVGINLLEKVQLPNLASLFGAMLAKVDVVLMGAGIPRRIPAILDRFAAGEPAEMTLDVAGALPGEKFVARFDPRPYLGTAPVELKRPQFLAIVSSATLAMTLARKSAGKVDGFVVEGSSAGGHNAPPRGAMTLDSGGEPVYGLRDSPDLQQIRALGLPFWLAGSYAEATKLAQALALGATGIQVGTAFAFCDESGLSTDLKERTLAACREGSIKVFTIRTHRRRGFRSRCCSRWARCQSRTSSKDVRAFVTWAICASPIVRRTAPWAIAALASRWRITCAKGGPSQRLTARKCVCNGLVAAVDYAKVRPSGETEPVLVTAGDDAANLHRFLRAGRSTYSADDVIDNLLGAPVPTS